MFGHIHGALNVDEKTLITQFTVAKTKKIRELNTPLVVCGCPKKLTFLAWMLVLG
jgi:hypothetical protein